MHISRRRFLALSATFTAAACSRDAVSDTPTTSVADTSPPTTTAPSTTTTTITTVAPSTTGAPTDAPTDAPLVELDADPFVFGVASGDPDPASVVLWTRLAGDLPADGVDVFWTFLGDSGEVVSGATRTDASVGGSVHVVADVNERGTYVFSAGGWDSPTGVTAPINPVASEVRLATASCQHYETGHYAAHRDIAEWAPDLVLFLGDFIYEGNASDPATEGVVRSHEGPEAMTLDGYRARYATYLGDQHLQACRAAAPWIAIWDDHEVENDYAGLISENNDDPAVFAGRRSAAYQAWWENTPTRLGPPDSDVSAENPYVIYRGVDIGSLLRISAVDGRQFRDQQVSKVILDPGPPVEGWDDPDRTMLGSDQEAWLTDRFDTTEATWNCLAQQTVFGDTRLGDNLAILNYDQWDGYHPARERLLQSAPKNFVTVTGDIHLAGVGAVETQGTTVGVEFVTTAISSSANVSPELVDVVLGIPAIVDAELEFRGYTRHTVTAETWTAEYRQVEVISDPDSPVRTWKSFQVQSGTPAVTEV